MSDIPSLIHESILTSDDLGFNNPDELILSDVITNLIEGYDILHNIPDFDDSVFDLDETLLPKTNNISHRLYGHAMDHENEIPLDTSILELLNLLSSRHLLQDIMP
jgi:hypothetical protein